jgi:hypothetical protein
MKTYQKVLFGLGILFLILLHRNLFGVKEGFEDSSDYNALKKRLTDSMGSYCKIANFVREQLKTMLSATGSGDAASIDAMYKAVYTCSDKLATSRPSCSRPNISMTYISCDIYTLPAWSSDTSSNVSALMKITDDLPERLVRESEWFASIIKQLNESLALGANPPTAAPSQEQMNEFKEGFTGICTQIGRAHV